MSAPPQLPPKKEVALALLEGPSLFVHLDPRADGVVVPKWLRSQAQLVLQIGMNMAVPIPDLRIEDEGISCTLSFNRSPFWCRLPWSAVYALVGEDGRGMVWPDDVPAELAQQSPRPQLSVVGAKKRKPRPKPAVAIVKDAPPEDEPADAGDEREDAVDEDVGDEREDVVDEDAAAERDADESTEPPAEDDAEGKKKLPPYLRVIK